MRTEPKQPSKTCTIQGTHCELCGSPATPSADNDGYSPCCNELIAYGPDGCRNHHGGRTVAPTLHRVDAQREAARRGAKHITRFGTEFVILADGERVERADGKAVATKHRKSQGDADSGWVVTWMSDWKYYTDPFPQRRAALEYMATEPDIENALRTA